MISEDLGAFLQGHWKDWKGYQHSVSVLSRSRRDDPDTSLVKSGFQEMYCFDDIVGDFFGGKNQCASADALYIGADFSHPDSAKRNRPCVYLIEFKPFSPDEEEQQENINESLYLKAVESYVILSRMVFPSCGQCKEPVRLVFWIVTNQREIAVKTGTSLRKKRKSGANRNAFPKKPSLEKQRRELDNAVNRLKKEITLKGQKRPYIYDDVQVIEVDRFQDCLRTFADTMSGT